MRSSKRYKGRAQCRVKYAAGWLLVNSGIKAGPMTCMWDATSVTDWGKWGLYLEYGAFGGGKMGRLEKIVMQLQGGAIVHVPVSQGSRERMALRLQNDPSRKTTVTVVLCRLYWPQRRGEHRTLRSNNSEYRGMGRAGERAME